MVDRSYVEQNKASRERLRAIVARLSEDELQRPLADGWSAAVHLAHLAFWDRRMLVLIEKWQRDGISASPFDSSVINDAALPQWRALPPRWVVDDVLAVTEQLDRKVATLSEEFLDRVRESGHTFRLSRAAHRDEHADELERAFGKSPTRS